MKAALGWALALLFATAGCAPKPASAPEATGIAVSHDPVDGRRWLERDATTATSLGAGPLSVVAADFGSDGDKVGAFVAIPNDQCLLAYARGSFGIDDLDLYAFADDGATLAIDEGSDPHPAIVICPPHPSRAYLAARIAQGRGIVALGVHPVSMAAIPQIGQALGARGRPGEELGRAESWPGLDERITERRRALGGEWEELRRVAVPADARAPTHVSTDLEPGHCLDVLVLPTEDLQALDVNVLDGDGRIVTRALSWGRDRTALVCSSLKTTVSVELRPHAGHGLAAVVLSRAPVSREIEGSVPVDTIGATLDLAAARTSRAKRLRDLGYPAPILVGQGSAEVGRKASFKVDLPEGCARVDVIGGKPIAGLVVDLWDASGKLIARGDGGAAPSLFACGRGGKGRIDVEATSRPGPFAIELRSDRNAPHSLVAHPLAASRLLDYLAARAPITASAASDARKVTLDATSLTTLDVRIPEGRCVDVVAALDAGGAGIGLRLLAGEGDEIALGRGHSLATTRACATAGLRGIKAELSLSSGKADALVLVRTVAIVPGR